MNDPLPRVTYANTGVDLSALHDHLDDVLPGFKSRTFGRHWPNLIGGAPDETGSRYQVITPIDGRTPIGSFMQASPAAVDRAVRVAADAFPAWASTPWQTRLARIERWGGELEAIKYDLALAVLEEVGKSRAESVGEVEECLDMIRYYCSEMRRNDGFVVPMKRAFAREETVDLLRPHGVFGVISPFNFPLALSVGMLTGALLTGNTVVFKPARGCALGAQLLVRSLAKAGVGAEANLVAGDDSVGRAIVAHPMLAGIAFTGSHEAGMAIFRAMNGGAFARPVIAEMGGKNPAYVSRHADLDVAAEGVARSAFGLQGQKCSACSVAYVDAAVKDAFLERLIGFTDTLVIGNPEHRSVFLGPLYDEAADVRHAASVDTARRDGAVRYGGGRVEPADVGGGFYRQPAIVEVPPGHRLTKDELFIPFLAVCGYDALGDAIRHGNDVPYGLTAGIYTADDGELERFLASAQAGALYANRRSGATTGAWPGIQSFCGWKGSGVSQKGGLGPHYLQQFMREQSHTLMR